MENNNNQLIEVCNVYGIDLTGVTRSIDEYIPVSEMKRHQQDFIKVYRKQKKNALPIKLQNGNMAIIIPAIDTMIIYRIVTIPKSEIK